MKHADIDAEVARAERAVTFADQDLRSALHVLGEGAPPRLAQIGVAAAGVALVGALLMRRSRRSGSRISRAMNYSVLLPLAANLIPRIVSALSAPRATSSYGTRGSVGGRLP